MPLARCPRLFGVCHLTEHDPRVERYPYLLVDNFALYDVQRRIVMASADLREYGPYVVLNSKPTSLLNVQTALRLRDGPYFWLGRFHRHFGHFLLTTMSRLWA